MASVVQAERWDRERNDEEWNHEQPAHPAVYDPAENGLKPAEQASLTLHG